MVAAGLCGLAVLALLTAGRLRGVRVLAAAGVAAVIWGWGVAQYPVLLPGTAVTLSNAGAPDTTLVAIVVLFVVAVVIVGPVLRAAVFPAGPPPPARRTTSARCWPPPRPTSPCRPRNRWAGRRPPPSGPRFSTLVVADALVRAARRRGR